ncbi:MAG: bacteriocin family protein [Anaerolineae bacterium]|nr:bacteriocin family protein [Anaerolineae bacterium]
MNQMNYMNYGRNKIDWNQEIWNRLDQAVHEEAKRIKIASKFLPLYGPMPEALTVPSDRVIDDREDREPLFIEEGETRPLIEIYSEFKLTPQQVMRESELMTAHTLAIRATNLLSQAEDLLIFQGQEVTARHPLFVTKRVEFRSGPAQDHLLKIPTDQIIEVPPLPPDSDRPGLRWGENAFEAVAEGYARLQNLGHYGPYALVLHHVPYADTYAPLKTTLIMPADRIKQLVTKGFFGTGTLPKIDDVEPSKFTGLLVSIGGNTMDLVVGKDVMTAFMQEDPDGNYRFRVLERFALRVKDPSAVVRLDFLGSSGQPGASRKPTSKQ